MKIRVEKEDLVQGLKKVVSVANSRIQPILTNVLIETLENKIQLTCDNLDIKIETLVNCEILEEGSITLPATKLLQIAESLKKEINIEDNLISENKTRIKLESISANKYPKNNQEIKFNYNFKIDSSILLKGLTKVIDIRDKDGILSGIYIGLFKDNIDFCGTNGEILAYYNDFVDNKDIYNFVINYDVIKEIIKLCSTDNIIDVYVNDSKLKIKTIDTVMESSLMNGQYPDFKRFIPINNNELIIEKSTFLDILKRVGIVYNEKERLSICLILDSGKLEVHYKDSNSEINEIMLVKYNAESYKFLFSFDYIQKLIKNIEDDFITIKIRDNQSAVTIHDNNYIAILTPRIK